MLQYVQTFEPIHLVDVKKKSAGSDSGSPKL